MRNHDPIVIRDIKGLYDRGDDEYVPLDHLISSLNTVYTHFGVKTRPGGRALTTRSSIGQVRRTHLYKKIGEAAPREIILLSTGEICDGIEGVTLATIAAATDFHGITLYNRFYFTPIQENIGGTIYGVPGETVWVYDGTTPARRITGSGPTAGAITAVAGGAGKVEVGQRLFAVSYETASGFITKAGPTVFTAFTGAGGTVVNLSTIPTGPAGTVARHILASKVVRAGWTGNQTDIELFFIPGGRIGDNTTTVYVANFYDAELQASADYLLDELTTVPAGVNLAEFKGRLGIAYGGDPATVGIYRLSKAGEPESFSSIDGFLLVGPGDSTGVNAGVSFRDTLVLHKEFKTFITSDNGQEPSSWEVIKIDDNIGCTHNGIMKGLDNIGTASPDNYIFASAVGLILFNGTIQSPPLTEKISDIWARLTPARLHTAHIVQDPINKLLYVPVTLDTGTTNPNYWIVGDFHNGLDAQNIKWSLWRLAAANDTPQSLHLYFNYATRALELRYMIGKVMMKLDPTRLHDETDLGVSTPIDSYVEVPMLGEGDPGQLNHFAAIKARVLGSGSLAITISGLDRTGPVTLNPWTLSATPGKEEQRICNFINERMTVKLEVNATDHWFHFSRLRAFVKFMWGARPEA